MKSRDDLSKILHTFCSHVYFQPDSNVKLVYPCIIYTFDGFNDKKADNKNYVTHGRYSITNIYKNPGNMLVDKFRSEDSPIYYIEWDRRDIIDGLYHDYYTLYF